jgi:AcrR family transcriptional regulator
MRRRAEQIDETRQHITEAAVRLHTSVGPANTTISGVADEAGVTRLTVYRHFEDLDALFVACMGHWNTLNPGPDLDAWRQIEPLEARAQRAFGEMYAWYAARHEELYPIYRDQAAMPESAQQAMKAQTDAIAAALVAPDAADLSVQAAVARHLVDFWTWRSLVAERGLDVEQATTAAMAMLLAVSPR